MKHFTSSDFWLLYQKLPIEIRELADKNYGLLKINPRHPSLQLKRIDELWSVRIGQSYRAIGIDAPAEFSRFGLGLMQIMIKLLLKPTLNRICAKRTQPA